MRLSNKEFMHAKKFQQKLKNPCEKHKAALQATNELKETDMKKYLALARALFGEIDDCNSCGKE